MRSASLGGQPSGCGGTRDITSETARPKRLGSKPATDDGCLTEPTRFTPGPKGEILSLFKDSPRRGLIHWSLAGVRSVGNGYRDSGAV
jgi:hypothetical protein